MTALADMPVTALNGWLGGKRNLAQRIIAQLGKHSAFWEIFCGSMAVTLSKTPCPMESVNDLHGDIINLARVIRDRQKGPQLYRRLRRVLMDKDLHAEAAAIVREPISNDSADLDRAEHYFIASWLGRGGVAGSRGYNYQYCQRYTKNGGHAATRFANAVASIPAWRRRLRNVTVLRQDSFTLLERIEDAKGVAIYADPPYLNKSRAYMHDFDAWDHQRLATLLARFKHTRVVISYYDHPRLAELYPSEAGWNRVSYDVSKAMASQGKRDGINKTRATEVLLVNGPILREEAA